MRTMNSEDRTKLDENIKVFFKNHINIVSKNRFTYNNKLYEFSIYTDENNVAQLQMLKSGVLTTISTLAELESNSNNKFDYRYIPTLVKQQIYLQLMDETYNPVNIMKKDKISETKFIQNIMLLYFIAYIILTGLCSLVLLSINASIINILYVAIIFAIPLLFLFLYYKYICYMYKKSISKFLSNVYKTFPKKDIQLINKYKGR